MSVVVTRAGVVQWQNPSLPSWSCGFDSHHPLHNARMQLSWIEQLPSKQQVGGSSPSIRAKNMVDVAQLVRVPGCGPGGRRFDPDHPPHFLTCQTSDYTVCSLTILIQGCSQAVRQRTLTPSSVSSNLAIPAKNRQVSTCRFFIHCESNGISSTIAMLSLYLISPSGLHTITPLGVYQNRFRNDDIQFLRN